MVEHRSTLFNSVLHQPVSLCTHGSSGLLLLHDVVQQICIDFGCVRKPRSCHVQTPIPRSGVGRVFRGTGVWRRGGTVVSTVTAEQEGPGFNSWLGSDLSAWTLPVLPMSVWVSPDPKF